MFIAMSERDVFAMQAPHKCDYQAMANWKRT
jgi:hypothetical protein